MTTAAIFSNLMSRKSHKWPASGHMDNLDNLDACDAVNAIAIAIAILNANEESKETVKEVSSNSLK